MEQLRTNSRATVVATTVIRITPSEKNLTVESISFGKFKKAFRDFFADDFKRHRFFEEVQRWGVAIAWIAIFTFLFATDSKKERLNHREVPSIHQYK